MAPWGAGARTPSTVSSSRPRGRALPVESEEPSRWREPSEDRPPTLEEVIGWPATFGAVHPPDPAGVGGFTDVGGPLMVGSVPQDESGDRQGTSIAWGGPAGDDVGGRDLRHADVRCRSRGRGPAKPAMTILLDHLALHVARPPDAPLRESAAQFTAGAGRFSGQGCLTHQPRDDRPPPGAGRRACRLCGAGLGGAARRKTPPRVHAEMAPFEGERCERRRCHQLIRAPGRSRTRNLVGRSHLLYPVELRGRGWRSA
jgi:hypothetical protein